MPCADPAVNLQLKLNYPRIAVTGDGNAIGRGVNRVRVGNTGVQNSLPAVGAGRC